MITILSQDKGTLIEAKEVDREYEDNTIWADDTMVGKYSTKEKTQKVMEQIVDHINNYANFSYEYAGENLYLGLKGQINTPNYTVFEMPQDEEV